MAQSKHKELIHIFGQTPHHYLPMQAFFSEVVRGTDVQQQFWVWEHPTQNKLDSQNYYLDSKDLLSRMKQQSDEAQFIFHGFMDRSVYPKLAFSPLAKRCSWVCWGADIYKHREKNRGFKLRVMHLLHAIIANRLKKKIALNNGDADLIKRLLKCNDVQVTPYPLIGGTDLPPAADDPVTRILVGNSAAPSNNHLQAFELLKGIADQNIRVVVPLNYAGEQEYVAKVISEGKRMFGDKFQPITEMLQKSEYDRLLANTDITVFTHDRQQGLFVVYSMLRYGKKLFLKNSTTTFEGLQRQNFHIFDSFSIPHLSFSDFTAIDPAVADKNRALMENTFSEQALKPQWLALFRQILSVV